MKRHLLLVFVLSIFSFSNIYSQQVCLNKAWKALDEEDYKTAIKNCDDCIKIFGDAAIKMQRELEEGGNTDESFPEGGADEATKDKIFKNWAVNDISTAFYIKGMSAKKLYNSTSEKSYKEMAEKAFDETCSLSFGRCWDPDGWFWSPCEAARVELSK